MTIQSRKVHIGSPVGALYTSIIKPIKRTGQHTPNSPLRSPNDHTPHRGMSSKGRTHQQAYTSTSSLTDSAVFYEPRSPASPSSKGMHLADGDSDEHHHNNHSDGALRARKRDKVKMVGHNLHTAFKSWFKDVSCECKGGCCNCSQS
jgi:hypothetical protein